MRVSKFAFSLICFAAPISAELTLSTLTLQGDSSPTLFSHFKRKTINIDTSLSIPKIDKFLSTLSPCIGEPITLNLLNGIARKIEGYYAKEGYPITHVIVVPEQDITKGVVILRIFEGKLGKVEAFGARYFSNKKIARNITTKPSALIRSKKMDEDLYWINNNSFRSTTLSYQKGKNLGETDVVLETKDRLPFRPFVGTQNTGNQVAGRARYFAGFNLGNLWGADHDINYQYTRATTLRRFWGHSGGYTAPLPWRHILKLFGYYSKTNPHMSHELDLTGRGWQMSGRYEVPFIKWRIIHNVFLNYDFKRTNNFLSFVKNTVYNTFIDVSQFSLGYEGRIEHTKAFTAFGGELTFSPGSMTAYNKNRYFEQERPNVKSRYFYGRLHLERTTPLFWNLSWRLSARGQFADRKLLPSEEFAVGGYLSVRGYLENQFVGDNGIVVRNELRLPQFSFKKYLKIKLGSLQFLGFVDYGKVWDADSNILHPDGTSLASVGPGLRYCWSDHVNVWLDYGWQIKRALTEGNGPRARVHVGASFAY